jgi:hypothetical protein
MEPQGLPDRRHYLCKLVPAMAKWQIGQKTQARADYIEAAAWLDKPGHGDAELRSVRTEAAAMLGIEDKK